MQNLGPKFTMGLKLKRIHKPNYPGPGAYNDIQLEVYKEKRPAYSLRAKTHLPTDNNSFNPGPNSYYTEKVKIFNSVLLKKKMFSKN